MSLAINRSLHPELREEEAVLVENAIRLAIESVINVLYGVNGARTHEYQRMVADRDKEIQRLECRLKRIEQEVQLLRRQGCTCELLANEPSLGGSQASGARQRGEQSGFDPGCMEADMTDGMSISLGLFARPPSHVSSQSHESAPPSSPSRVSLDQACISHSSETSGVSEARNLPASPSSLVVKEEPCDNDAALIKWEMSEERFRERHESAGSPCLEEESLAMKYIQENQGRSQFRENVQGDPGGGLLLTEAENLRNKKKNIPLSELPEEAQRQKRAAWRAASRRYYARKIARQKAHHSHPDPFPHISASQYSQPLSFFDKRRTLMSHLPEESQMMQREAWRAASSRYYARKIARHQADPSHYGHLLQNIEASGETQEPDRTGSHSNSEGIMCS